MHVFYIRKIQTTFKNTYRNIRIGISKNSINHSFHIVSIEEGLDITHHLTLNNNTGLLKPSKTGSHVSCNSIPQNTWFNKKIILETVKLFS